MIALRRFALPILLAVLTLVPVSTAIAAEGDPFRATVNQIALNVRSGPGLGYSVREIIYECDRVQVYGRDSACVWAAVETESGVDGWVGNHMVDSLGISGDFCAQPILETYYPRGYVSAPVTNVRTGPGTDYTVVDTAAFPTNVNMIGRSADSAWLYVIYTDESNITRQNWVASSSITTGTHINTLAVLDSDDEPEPTPTPQPPDDDNGGGGGGGGGDTEAPSDIVSGNEALIQAQALNFRSGPGLGYGVIDVLLNGDVVSMTGRTSDARWTRVVDAGRTGWVSTAYIFYRVEAFNALPIVDETSASGIVNTGALNVRQGPSTAYDIITAIPQGTSVTLLGRNLEGSWLYVRLANGTLGWLSAAYIDTSISVLSLPVE